VSPAREPNLRKQCLEEEEEEEEGGERGRSRERLMRGVWRHGV